MAYLVVSSFTATITPLTASSADCIIVCFNASASVTFLSLLTLLYFNYILVYACLLPLTARNVICLI